MNPLQTIEVQRSTIDVQEHKVKDKNKNKTKMDKENNKQNQSQCSNKDCDQNTT